MTRLSRLASSTRASAKTAVYWGGALGGGFSSFSIPSGESDSLTGTVLGAAAFDSFFGAGAPSTIEPGFAACHFSMPSRPPSSAGWKPLPLTVWMWSTTGRLASNASASAARRAPTSWPSITPT